MKSKTFVLLLLSAFFAAFCVLVISMSVAHKMWKTYDWKMGVTNQGNAMTGRQEKADYLSQDNLPYDAFIIGGSKAGALQSETFSKYTARTFYNFYVSSGNFRDFELYADFMLEQYKGDVKEIVLHLSSHESEAFTRVPFIPVQMQKNIFSKLHSFAQVFREKYLNINTLVGLRNSKINMNPCGISTQYGARSQADDDFTLTELQKDGKFETQVLSYWESYEQAIYDLFYQSVSLPACDKNISALKRIKEKCDEYGVKLTVVIGPTFIAELYKYKSEQYANYLKNIVSVCGSVWNFSGINDVDMNPYNFYNGGHCWIFVADKMIETMYSAEPNTSDMDLFGILLTSDNIGAYIESQREKWRALKAEYDKTGAITLQGKTDASYLAR